MPGISDSECRSTETATKPEIPLAKSKPNDFENSMIFGKESASHDISCTDDSFLELERQCNIEEQKQQILNANETCLFDIEPPSELFNETVNQTVDQTSLLPMPGSPLDYSSSFEMSSVKYIGLMRPSTIIEETSSQLDSSSNLTEVSASNSQSISDSIENNENSVECTPTITINPTKNRNRRGTFAFKRKNYTFFTNEPLKEIDEDVSQDTVSSTTDTETSERDLISFDEGHETSAANESDHRPFNDTIEAVDYFLEKGRELIEQTPVANRDAFQRSVLETPLFSCKRKRMLGEMANEMMPLPKRGPLIDISTPEPRNKSTFQQPTRFLN